MTTLSKAQKYQIYMLLVFVMFAWGLNVTATKVIVAAFDPITITSLRILTAGISVFIILAFLKKVRLPTKNELVYIFLGGIFNITLHHYFISLGLLNTTATNGGLILGLSPLLSTIVAFIFLGNKVTVVGFTGIILGFTGVSFIVMEGPGGISNISLGDLYVLLSIIFQAISYIFIKKIAVSLDPRLMTGYMLLTGSIILFIIGLFKEPNGLESIPNGSFGIWMIFLASAVMATAVGHMIYNFSIQKVGITEASIFVNLTPFFSLVCAVIFLGEKITFSHILGFILILLGVLFGSGALEEIIRQSKRKQKEHSQVKRTV